jgi:predicted PurR-regulated permease PerM
MEPTDRSPESEAPVLVPGTPVPEGERRSEVKLARATFGLLLALAAFGVAYLASPFAAPLFLAVVLASLLHGLFERFARLLRGRRYLAAALFTLGVLLVLVAPFASILAFLAREAALGLAYVRDTLGVHSVGQLESGHLPPRAEALLDRFLGATHLSRARLSEYAGHYAGRAQEWGTMALHESTHLVMQTFAMLVAFFFFAVDGDRVVGLIARVSPLEERQTRELFQEFRKVSHAAVLGTVATAVFQGVAVGIGLKLTGIPHPIFFGVLTMLMAFIPVVGTALVWVPAVGVLLLAGRPVAALVLAGWCLVVVAGGEHLIKPLVLRGRVEMNTGLVLLGLLGGLETFGLLGVVLGPVIVAFFVALLKMYERDFVGRRRQRAEVH